jgi:hypothetical protein
VVTSFAEVCASDLRDIRYAVGQHYQVASNDGPTGISSMLYSLTKILAYEGVLTDPTFHLRAH